MVPAHLRRIGGRLSSLNFVEFAQMVLPKKTRDYEVLLGANMCRATKPEILSALYMLRYTQGCPNCGTHCQRDASFEGCPSVKCPACRTCFECQAVAGYGTTCDDPFALTGYTPIGSLPGYQRSALAQLFDCHLDNILQADLIKQELAEALSASRHPTLPLVRGLLRGHLLDLARDVNRGNPAFSKQNLASAAFACGVSISPAEIEYLVQRFDAFGASKIELLDMVDALALAT